MALFKNKQDPPADPPAGDDDGGDGNGGGEPQYMTMEQFAEQIKPLQDTLSTVNESLKAINKQPAYQQPQTPAPPAEDPHKAQKDRIVQIDKELEDLAAKADDAAYQGKGVGDLMKRQNQLYQERSEVQGQILAGQRDPRIDMGFQTLDAISTEITSGKMEYLSLPEVKETYEQFVDQLAPEQRMNPQAKMGCYHYAVGVHQDAIKKLEKEKWLREAEEGEQGTQTPPAGSATGRQHPSNEGEVTPEMAFSPEALRSIKTSRHRTVENYVRSLGYDGWEDYVEKNKDYLIEEQEEGA